MENSEYFRILAIVPVGLAIASTICRAAHQQSHLLKRVISPHISGYTTAMHLLQSGVDITVMALWLGHESPATTH
jgi:site-specific recombinase XerD